MIQLSNNKLHVDHIAEEIGEDTTIRGVIILPMILGGDIYQIHTYKRSLYLRKYHRGIIPGGAMIIERE
jgi:hypothetical protein